MRLDQLAPPNCAPAGGKTMSYSNYHSHTTFCDGADTPETMLLSAIEHGCPEFGFSGHSYLPFDPGWTMSPETAANYRSCISSLKEKYKDKISVRLGVEQDYCSDPGELPLYEYVIGAVHCVFKDGVYISVDASADSQKAGIDNCYGGDPYAFVEDYYKMVGGIYEKTHCTIVAHFDLVTKFMEQRQLFSTAERRYVRAADEALDRLLETPAAFEVNTGAMSRGYRSSPYPDDRILDRLGQAHAKVILSADAHSRDAVVYKFDEALALCRRHGIEPLRSLDELLD